MKFSCLEYRLCWKFKRDLINGKIGKQGEGQIEGWAERIRSIYLPIYLLTYLSICLSIISLLSIYLLSIA